MKQNPLQIIYYMNEHAHEKVIWFTKNPIKFNGKQTTIEALLNMNIIMIINKNRPGLQNYLR